VKANLFSFSYRGQSLKKIISAPGLKGKSDKSGPEAAPPIREMIKLAGAISMGLDFKSGSSVSTIKEELRKVSTLVLKMREFTSRFKECPACNEQFLNKYLELMSHVVKKLQESCGRPAGILVDEKFKEYLLFMQGQIMKFFHKLGDYKKTVILFKKLQSSPELDLKCKHENLETRDFFLKYAFLASLKLGKPYLDIAKKYLSCMIEVYANSAEYEALSDDQIEPLFFMIDGRLKDTELINTACEVFPHEFTSLDSIQKNYLSGSRRKRGKGNRKKRGKSNRKKLSESELIGAWLKKAKPKNKYAKWLHTLVKKNTMTSDLIALPLPKKINKVRYVSIKFIVSSFDRYLRLKPRIKWLNLLLQFKQGHVRTAATRAKKLVDAPRIKDMDDQRMTWFNPCIKLVAGNFSFSVGDHDAVKLALKLAIEALQDLTVLEKEMLAQLPSKNNMQVPQEEIRAMGISIKKWYGLWIIAQKLWADSVEHLVENADLPLTLKKLVQSPTGDWLDYFLIGDRQIKMGHFRDAAWCFSNAERLYDDAINRGIRMIRNKKVKCLRQIDLYVKTRAIALDSDLDPRKLTVKIKCNRPDTSKNKKVICTLRTKLNPGMRVVIQDLPTKIDHRDIYCFAKQAKVQSNASNAEKLKTIEKNEKAKNITERSGLKKMVNPRNIQKEPIDDQKQDPKKRKVIKKKGLKKKSGKKHKPGYIFLN